MRTYPRDNDQEKAMGVAPVDGTGPENGHPTCHIQEQPQRPVANQHFEDLNFGSSEIDLSFSFSENNVPENQVTVSPIRAHKNEITIGDTLVTQTTPNVCQSSTTTHLQDRTKLSPPRPRNRLVKNNSRRHSQPTEVESKRTERPPLPPPPLSYADRSTSLVLPADHHVTFTEDAVTRPLTRPRTTSYSKEWRQIVKQNETLAGRDAEGRITWGFRADSYKGSVNPTAIEYQESLDEPTRSYAPSRTIQEPRNGTVLDLTSPEKSRNSASWLKKIFSKNKEPSHAADSS
ncbi:hypothetical protein PV10_03820 [Exophiala mesophila]|uniref:Uncharacterized protein n=1 Tax=Exophiala mesophila TaxID=212818 RepID=A0A0D1ZFB8_EXOME|nr:uncharacterized protein PV10_03820 [Exophiala mesophila]KIV92529.1 hypothetical protein PV10_03820 [Exophiala mesophila]